MYSHVSTWTDLCKTNVEFLEGKHEKTFYHCGPIDLETSQDPRFLNSLIELNNLGLFTYNSQPYKNPNTNIFPGIYQISYVNFHCEQTIAYKLLPLMLADNSIYFSFHSISKSRPGWIDNFPSQKFNLTKEFYNETNYRDYSNWNKKFMIDDSKILEPELYGLAKAYLSNIKITELLEDSVSICICGRDYTAQISIPEKILELIKKIDISLI